MINYTLVYINLGYAQGLVYLRNTPLRNHLLSRGKEQGNAHTDGIEINSQLPLRYT